MKRIRTNGETAFGVTDIGRNIQRHVQRGKFISGGKKGVDIRALDLRTVDNEVGDLHQKLA